MPRIRTTRDGRRRRMTCSRNRELPELIELLGVITSRSTALLTLQARLGWSWRRLATRIEGLRQRGVRIVTADRLTARVVDPAAALKLLNELAPNRRPSAT